MLNSAKDSKHETFLAAVERAREDGLSLADMQSMITASVDIPQTNGSVHPTGPDDVIYDVLPEGLIDLPSASKKYGIKVGTLRSWVHVGKLPRMGRLRGRAPGGGYIVTRDADIEYCRDHPRKRGPKGFTTS